MNLSSTGVMPLGVNIPAEQKTFEFVAEFCGSTEGVTTRIREGSRILWIFIDVERLQRHRLSLVCSSEPCVIMEPEYTDCLVRVTVFARLFVLFFFPLCMYEL